MSELKVHFCTPREEEIPMPIDEVGFDLKAPCDDCPFTKNAPPHEGVLAAFPKYWAEIKRGMFAHTCHKTDFRSDSKTHKFVKGKTQHCVGMIWMCENSDKTQLPYLNAWAKKKFKFEDLKGKERAFTWSEFLAFYKAYAKKVLKERRKARLAGNG